MILISRSLDVSLAVLIPECVSRMNAWILDPFKICSAFIKLKAWCNPSLDKCTYFHLSMSICPLPFFFLHLLLSVSSPRLRIMCSFISAVTYRSSYILEKKKKAKLSISLSLALFYYISILSHPFCLAVHIDRWVCQFTESFESLTILHDMFWSHIEYQPLFTHLHIFTHRGHERENNYIHKRNDTKAIWLGSQDPRSFSQTGSIMPWRFQQILRHFYLPMSVYTHANSQTSI